jgi:hypothetical protein
MNAQELQNFLADSPPTTVNLVIRKHFEALDDQQRRYAHYISKYDPLASNAGYSCGIFDTPGVDNYSIYINLDVPR